MNELFRILSNSAFIAVQKLTNAFLQFLFFLLLIHTLSEYEMGIFELGRACLEIGAGIVAPGLAIILLREGSRDPYWFKQHESTVHLFLISASLIVALSIFFLANIASMNLNQILVTGLFCLSIYFQGSCIAYESYLIALDQVKWSMIISVLCNLGVTLSIILLILFTPYPLLGASVLLFIRWIINQYFYRRRIHTATPPQPVDSNRSPLSLIQLLIASWPLTIGSIFFIIYARIDTLMLEWMGNPASIALYSGAYRLIGLLSLMFLSIYQALAPSISRALTVSYKRTFYLVSLIGTLLGVFGLILAIFIQYSGSAIISQLYPENYEATAQGLFVLAWTLPIIFAGNAFGYFLVNETSRGPKYYAVINLLGLLINFTGNWILIPQYDFIGAAWMTVATDGVTTLLMVAGVVYITFISTVHRSSNQSDTTASQPKD